MALNQFAARMRSATACVVLLLAFAQQLAFSKPAQKSKDTPPQAPLVIRVGAIYYDDSDKEYEEINAILVALEKQAQNSPKNLDDQSLSNWTSALTMRS
jgi:hypothetical protein